MYIKAAFTFKSLTTRKCQKKTHKTIIDNYCSSVEVKSKKLINFNIKDNIHS